MLLLPLRTYDKIYYKWSQTGVSGFIRVFAKCSLFAQLGDKTNIIKKKRLLYSNSLSLVWGTEMIALYHRDTADREDI